MNEVVREVEERRPGVCHHEAAHVVFAYYSDHPIAYVKVGEKCECVYKVQYVPGDVVATIRDVSGILAGRYAEELAHTGKPREHVPFEEISKGIKEWLRTEERSGFLEKDELDVFMKVRRLGRVYAENVYKTACDFAAKKVESRWDEICSVAAQLREVGYLDGDECARIIESVAQAKESREEGERLVKVLGMQPGDKESQDLEERSGRERLIENLMKRGRTREEIEEEIKRVEKVVRKGAAR